MKLVSKSKRGKLITLEGGDGVGKTTILKLLEKHLLAMKTPILCTREPGGTRVSEEIRKIILSSELRPTPMTELFLFEAARSQHIEELIIPALNAGITVICDRFIHSSLVFQGITRGLGIPLVRRLNTLATRNILPDLVLFLKLDPKLALKRIDLRSDEKSRLDKEKTAFHKKVYQGFIKLSKDKSFLTLDARKSPDTIFKSIIEDKQWKKLFPHHSL